MEKQMQRIHLIHTCYSQKTNDLRWRICSAEGSSKGAGDLSPADARQGWAILKLRLMSWEVWQWGCFRRVLPVRLLPSGQPMMKHHSSSWLVWAHLYLKIFSLL